MSPPAPPPRAVCQSITIRREAEEFMASLAFAFGDESLPQERFAAEILGPKEQGFFATLRFPCRQESYLLGRYAAKRALQRLLGTADLREIEVGRGVFEQPIVGVPGQSPSPGVTISHAGPVAVALAFPAGHPMGIDLEALDPARLDTVFSQLSQEETAVVDRVREEGGRLRAAFALWSAKEALSKVLLSGLMSPLSIYNLSRFERSEGGIWEGEFQNFAQYKAMTLVGTKHVLSIVAPKRSALSFGSDLARWF